jgi:hypothetical protein
LVNTALPFSLLEDSKLSFTVYLVIIIVILSIPPFDRRGTCIFLAETADNSIIKCYVAYVYMTRASKS